MKRTLLIFSLLAASVACRPVSIPPGPGPDDPGIPGPGEEQTVSVAFLKTLYKGAPVRITGEYRIAGAVVSDDRLGNFYKTLVIDDGTGGIEVRLDEEEIFKRYMIHTRATVRCSGLWLGSYGGTLQLGAEPFGDFSTQPLSQAEMAEHLFPDNEFYGEVMPRVLTISQLATRHISTFVAFEGVSFAAEERGSAWAETQPDPLTGEEPPSGTDRHLVDGNGDTLIVRTSRYARFAHWTLPEGRGRIEGVVGYFNGVYQLTVCDSQKAQFEISGGR